MRMRSCQIVYLFLLLCSVQVTDVRAAELLAMGHIGAVASMEEPGSATGWMAHPRQDERAPQRLAVSGLRGVFRPPVIWAGPAKYAAAVSTFTSFGRPR